MISLVLVSSVFATVFFVWYPEPAFEVVGAINIIRLLVVVDLIMGPLLTLIVYKQGKPGLKFDLAVIALMQIAALVYGSHRLYEERPQYMVFVVDRVEFISTRNVDTSEIRYEDLRNRPLTELIAVFARRPVDGDEFQRYLDSVMVDGKPDLERRPEYWEPWSAGAEEIRKYARPLADFESKSPAEQQNVRRALEQYGGEHPDLGVLPIGGVEKDIALLVDRDTLDVLGTLDVNPWPPNQEEAATGESDDE